MEYIYTYICIYVFITSLDKLHIPIKLTTLALHYLHSSYAWWTAFYFMFHLLSSFILSDSIKTLNIGVFYLQFWLISQTFKSTTWSSL